MLFYYLCLVNSFWCAEDEVLNLVIEYDVNGDGTIDFDEFLGKEGSSTKLTKQFQIFSRN